MLCNALDSIPGDLWGKPTKHNGINIDSGSLHIILLLSPSDTDFGMLLSSLFVCSSILILNFVSARSLSFESIISSLEPHASTC